MIIGIDPGPDKSGVVTINDRGELLHADNMENAAVCGLINSLTPTYRVAMEDFTPYGQRLGYESIATIKWLGEFRRCCKVVAVLWSEIERPAVKLHLCGVKTATDADVRDALIHRYGPGKDRAIGKKRTPGPLYGINSHLWPALAVAVTALDRSKTC